MEVGAVMEGYFRSGRFSDALTIAGLGSKYKVLVRGDARARARVHRLLCTCAAWQPPVHLPACALGDREPLAAGRFRAPSMSRVPVAVNALPPPPTPTPLLPCSRPWL